MKTCLAIIILTSATTFAGELPELLEKPWTAWYSGYEGKKFQFGVSPDGDASLIPLVKKSGERISQHSWFSINPVIQEVLPNGNLVTKKPLEDGWEAITPESAEAEKVSYRATVTGGARYEVHFVIDGDEVYCSGQILDKGELTANPIRFAVQVKVPNSYRHTKDAEVLEEKVKDDRIEFVMASKVKEKFKGEVPMDEVAKACKEIRSVEVDIAYYDGAKFEVDGGDIGLLEIIKPNTDPVAQGFALLWVPDPVKNAGGKAKLMLKYK